MARLTYNTEDGEYSVSVVGGHLTADEFLDGLVRPVMLAAGYHPDTVEEALGHDDSDDLGDLGV